MARWIKNVCLELLLAFGLSACGDVIPTKIGPIEDQRPGYTSEMQQRSLDEKAYVPGEILFGFNDSLSKKAAESKAKEINAERVAKGITKEPINVFKLKFNGDIEDKIKELKEDISIKYAEPNYIMSTYSNDPLYEKQWHLNNIAQEYFTAENYQQTTTSGTEDADIDLPEAWEVEQSGREVIVAVIDTGVDFNHPDLQGKAWNGPNEIHGYNTITHDNNVNDTHGHGTHCAGVITANTDNGLGVAGIANHTDVKIMAVKFLDPSGTLEDGIEAIIWAVENGAEILSASWGGNYNQSIQEAINYSIMQGVNFVAAAGNDNIDSKYYSPAGNEGVLTVSATDSKDLKAIFSNYGESVEIAAPGVDILSLRAAGTDMYGYGANIVDTNYYFCSGTSMACPQVAGILAMVKAKYPNMDFKDQENLVIYSADDIYDKNPEFRNMIGIGRANAHKALIAVPGPFFNILEINVDDESHNGVISQGERATLELLVKNMWMDAGMVTVELSADNPNMNIIDSTEYIIEFNSSETKELTFEIQAGNTGNNTNINFTMDFNYGNGEAQRNFTIMMEPYLQTRKIIDIGHLILGSPVVADLDNDGLQEIVIADYIDKVYVYGENGKIRLGWPLKIITESPYMNGVQVNPAVGDVNGDGRQEVVFSISSGGTYAVDPDGKVLRGFPIKKSGMFPRDASPVLADLNGDGKKEIIASLAGYNYKNYIFVFDGDGKTMDGWERGSVAISSTNATPSVADINNDGSLDVIIGDWDYNMNAFDRFGNPLGGSWNQNKGAPFISSPGITDIDNDGYLEIFNMSTGDAVYAWNSEGDALEGWPVTIGGYPTGENKRPSVAIGDIDLDGKKEIIVPHLMGLASVIDLEGNIKWSKYLAPYLNASPIIANVDDDPELEIIFAQNSYTDFGITIFNHDGSELGVFPSYGSISATPVACDIDNDGKTELIIANINGQVFIVDTLGDYVSNTWSRWKYDNNNTGFMP
ncbi:S8 family serine peptidase [Candidatus Woesearchaeota archaeon]|nr:S8 family serine peptidase [Candidatus Woesearchaeota archaeon]